MAWRRRREIPARVLPWLLGVTRRALADQRRSIRRRLGLVDRVVLHRVEPPAGDPADEVTARAVVLAALGELPPVTANSSSSSHGMGSAPRTRRSSSAAPKERSR